MKTEEMIPLENFFASALKETLEEIDVTQKEVAQATGIPESHLSDMKLGRRRCTPEYDLRLARYLGTSEGRWLRLQLAYDLDHAKREKGNEIASEVSTLA
jgi:addiction module HigA family antidote